MYVMSQRIGKSERFSVESIAKALERDRPSEALLAIAYLRTRSITIDAYLDTGLPTLMYDFSSPEGKIRAGQISNIRMLLRGYENDKRVDVFSNDRYFLRTKALWLKLRDR